jgi:2-dehydro-3-deoxyphosphogluconate aldolase/(4S)-4-hydroxy-2-oxoglutarate aldolase
MEPDFVKVVPCGHIGGDGYIRDLKAMFPNVPLVAAGGVNQQTASSFILAGAIALGIGVELIPREAIRMRQADRIAELARRFTGFVSVARGRSPSR